MTFFSSVELPTTQPLPTSAPPRMKAQCLTSVSGPMMQGPPSQAEGKTFALFATQTSLFGWSYSAGSSPAPRRRMRSGIPSSASQG